MKDNVRTKLELSENGLRMLRKQSKKRKPLKKKELVQESSTIEVERVDDEDNDLLDPIPYELEAIELARKHTKQYSYRQVANWITKKTGRVISHVGLRKRLMHEQQRKNKARTLRKWSEYAQKAIEKAKAIEEERTGSRV